MGLLYIKVPYIGRRGGLQIERSGFNPWLGHWVGFLGKTLYSQSASLHPGV